MKKEVIHTEDNIKISTGQNEKGTFVDLEISENIEVFINGVLFVSKHPKEEYKYIPPVMRDFIQKESYSLSKDNYCKSIIAEIKCGGMDFTSYFPLNFDISNGIHYRFTTIVSPSDMEDLLKDCYLSGQKEEIENIMADVNSMWLKLTKFIDDNGFRFEFSHSMNEGYYGWWDIVIKVEQWDEMKFISCIEEIKKFNNLIIKIEKEYNYF